MAAKMKKLCLLAMNADRARLIRKLQRLGCVEIIGQSSPLTDLDGHEAERRDELIRWIERLDDAIQKLSRYDPIRSGLFASRPTAGEDAIVAAQAWRGTAAALVGRFEEIERAAAELGEREARERALIAELTPWAALEIPVERVGETECTVTRLLALPHRRRAQFMEAAAALEVPPALTEVSSSRGAARLCVCHHRAVSCEMGALIRESGAKIVTIGGKGTAALLIDQAQARLRRIDEVRAQLKGELPELGRDIHTLRVLRDADAMGLARMDAAAQVSATRSAFLLTGWVPVNRTDRIEGAVRGATATYELGFFDPEKGERPPVMLRNMHPRFLRAIAGFLSGFHRRMRKPLRPLTYETRYVDIDSRYDAV